MKRMLYALTPIMAASVYFFGWRVLLMLVLVSAAGFAAEYAFVRSRKEPVTSAVFVTCCLYTLSLPPTLPLWMAVLGVVFAVTFGKMVFGGFGKNVFNPALTGRAFIYICFGDYMTGRWSPALPGPWGGLVRYAAAPDAITSATPGMLLKTGQEFSLWQLFMGNISGTLGGTSALLAILGGLYIIYTKAANYRIVVTAIAGYICIQGLLWFAGVKGAIDPLRGIMAGSFMIGAFFYATDPVSAPKTNQARWIYGSFIGVMSSLITTFSAWPAGTMFSILLANMFAPITDHFVRELKTRK